MELYLLIILERVKPTLPSSSTSLEHRLKPLTTTSSSISNKNRGFIAVLRADITVDDATVMEFSYFGMFYGGNRGDDMMIHDLRGATAMVMKNKVDPSEFLG
ncbi:hypothetical protein HAX54_048737 [Datura stramonium]|uniref:Uncharacterized protein n=1 Tax=Datura stramonium TaxID=4076 RepID=A0ABS8WMF9_DATST|nr:hypothetical protein [Datura stramonium]